MKVPWFSIEAPDDDGESLERDDSGENYVAKLRAVAPPAVIVMVSAERMDAEIARHGVLNGEDDPEAVGGIINAFFSRFFRRNH